MAASKWKYKLSYEQYSGGVVAIGKKRKVKGTVSQDFCAPVFPQSAHSGPIEMS